VLPGNTSKTLWQRGEYHPVSELPQVFNPPSGYVFNTNNSPFYATQKGENKPSSAYDATMGFEKYQNNRSLRLSSLLENHKGKFSYEDFKRIKYDLSYPDSLAFTVATNLNDLYKIESEKYPDLIKIFDILDSWDRENTTESIGASIFMVFLHYLGEDLRTKLKLKAYNKVSESEIIAALRETKKHLENYFNTIEVPLGKIQVHQRGKVELPMPGNQDVIAAMYSKPYKKGKFKTNQGESYILLVRFSEKGVELESINAYGASNHKKSPHYTDQMEKYTNQELKKMSLSKEEALKNAVKIYAPK
jgi:acyl-homoserine-lactone acylase